MERAIPGMLIPSHGITSFARSICVPTALLLHFLLRLMLIVPPIILTFFFTIFECHIWIIMLLPACTFLSNRLYDITPSVLPTSETIMSLRRILLLAALECFTRRPSAAIGASYIFTLSIQPSRCAHPTLIADKTWTESSVNTFTKKLHPPPVVPTGFSKALPAFRGLIATTDLLRRVKTHRPLNDTYASTSRIVDMRPRRLFSPRPALRIQDAFLLFFIPREPREWHPFTLVLPLLIGRTS
jgi:hypothetical protein